MTQLRLRYDVYSNQRQQTDQWVDTETDWRLRCQMQSVVEQWVTAVPQALNNNMFTRPHLHAWLLYIKHIINSFIDWLIDYYMTCLYTHSTKQ